MYTERKNRRKKSSNERVKPITVAQHQMTKLWCFNAVANYNHHLNRGGVTTCI